MAPTVSIIVPVYNVAAYLPQCLDSIVGQSYAHLEVLLVDDGSTDGSGDICDQWALRDSRIRVIHKANGGLSDARNAALECMTGTLVMMVDSDDYITPDCVETLVKLLDDTRCDIAVGQWQMFDDHTQSQPHNRGNGRVTVFGRDQAIEHIFYQDTLTHSVCSRIFRASLFERLRFPVGMLYEDLAVAYPLMLQVSRVAFTTRVVYLYRQHPSSITGHFTRQRTHVLDILEALEEQVARDNPQFLPAVQSRLLSACFNIMLLCPRDGAYNDIIDRCWRGICRLRWHCVTDRRVRAKNRLGILASLVGKMVFLRLFSGKILKKY